VPPVAITARRPTAWRGALLAARCSSGDGEQGEMRWMPIIGLSLGYAASIFATPVNASGSDADDSDATADEPGGESRADFVLRRRKEQEEKLRRRRREDRGGGDPTPRGQLHVSKAEQYERDTSAEAILSAIEYDCRCNLPHCVRPTSDIIKRCCGSKLTTKNFGNMLRNLLRSAVVEQPDGSLLLDNLNGQVTIFQGVHACPRRFRRIFAVKPRMWSTLKKQVEQPVMDSSVWGVRPSDSPAGMCGEMAASWFRKWAELVGCYPPNAATSIQIHIDAKTKTTIWGLFVLEQPDYAISYQHFAKVMGEEAARPPKICMRHKKDVSSACSDCIRLNENLAAALESRDFNHIEAAKKVLAAHCERVRQERRFYMDTITQASYSPAPLLSCVWDIMDQKKCNFPNWKGPLALAMAGAQRMPLKLLGFTWHGDRWYGFTAPPWVPKGANLTCSAVYLALLDAKERRARLPPVLKICIDGGSENWNHTTFSFFSHLVTIRVFSEVWLFRMPVGHTHNDQDQKYSRISVGLHGADSMDTGCASLTPDEWTETLRNSFLMEQAKPHMKWLSSIFDFDAFYHSSQACLKGYGASTQYTRVGTEEARLEEEKRSHFRYVPPLRS